MDDNTMRLIEKLMANENEIAGLRAKVHILKALIDSTDEDYAKSGTHGLIKTTDIRSIFGWGKCEAAEELLLEKKYCANV